MHNTRFNYSGSLIQVYSQFSPHPLTLGSDQLDDRPQCVSWLANGLVAADQLFHSLPSNDNYR